MYYARRRGTNQQQELQADTPRLNPMYHGSALILLPDVCELPAKRQRKRKAPVSVFVPAPAPTVARPPTRPHAALARPCESSVSQRERHVRAPSWGPAGDAELYGYLVERAAASPPGSRTARRRQPCDRERAMRGGAAERTRDVPVRRGGTTARPVPVRRGST